VPAGSGEIIEELLSERRQVHLVSPADDAFIEIGNAESRERGKGELVGDTSSLVRSPIVIAMWRDMAEAIGWPRKSIRWRDFFDLARDPTQWKQVARPQWRSFKYGHTHPEFSNSGLHALLIEAYAGLGKFENVTRRDLNDNLPMVSQYVREVENSVVHYGRSTGFLNKKMQEQGKAYLSAAILYENLVIEANQDARKKDPTISLPQVVAIYPAEGTFPSAHPVGIVQRPWVTAGHTEAAQLYINFLLTKEIQVEAKKSGFRPSDNKIPLADLLRTELGVDPAQPKRILKPPPNSAISIIREVFRKNKRPADIVLAIDTSNSMRGDKIRLAEGAAKEFIGLLGEVDTLSTVIFGAEVEWLAKNLLMDSAGKREAIRSIDGLVPDGDTALYQAISASHQFLMQRDRRRTRAVVVLSDGDDTKRTPLLADLLTEIRNNGEEKSIFVFTIGYGADANEKILTKIAEEAKSQYYKGLLDTIHKVFADLATFF
jgi:Ca-activated chloride channel family protein